MYAVGCNGGAPPSSGTPKPTQPPATSPAAIPPTTTPQSAIPGVYAKACETECADDLAELVTYRDAAGTIAVVTVQGSTARCSHPPLRFLGPDGSERAVIPLEPVVPGSDRAKHFDETRTQQVGGLTKAETIFCRDVKH
jgi:hypothetical protein